MSGEYWHVQLNTGDRLVIDWAVEQGISYRELTNGRRAYPGASTLGRNGGLKKLRAEAQRRRRERGSDSAS